MSSLEAMHNLSRERELMAFMLANGSRFDPMALALAANPLQVGDLERGVRADANSSTLLLDAASRGSLSAQRTRSIVT